MRKSASIAAIVASCFSKCGGSEGKEPACKAEDPGLIPGGEDPLEKGMAIHSSILAWRM